MSADQIASQVINDVKRLVHYDEIVNFLGAESTQSFLKTPVFLQWSPMFFQLIQMLVLYAFISSNFVISHKNSYDLRQFFHNALTTTVVNLVGNFKLKEERKEFLDEQFLRQEPLRLRINRCLRNHLETIFSVILLFWGLKHNWPIF